MGWEELDLGTKEKPVGNIVCYAFVFFFFCLESSESPVLFAHSGYQGRMDGLDWKPAYTTRLEGRPRTRTGLQKGGSRSFVASPLLMRVPASSMSGLRGGRLR